jgi:hypothetical protein
MVADNLADIYAKTGNHQKARLWMQRSSAALKESLGSEDSFAQDVDVQCREFEHTQHHHKAVRAKSSTAHK